MKTFIFIWSATIFSLFLYLIQSGLEWLGMGIL